MATKKIKSIEFSVLGPDKIRQMSAAEITRSETYDKDGYPIERGVMDLHMGIISPGLRCKTCGNNMRDCPGHFGHIELIRPVMHPKFADKIEILLKNTCRKCGRVMIDEDEINHLITTSKDVNETIKLINTEVKKTKQCPHCETEIPKVSLDKPTNFYADQERIYPSEILEWILKIPKKDLFLFGYSDKLSPQFFVLTVLGVPPVAIRPSLSLENVITAESDLTHMLLNIVRINNRLQENITAGAPQIIIEDLWDLLQYHITTYFDNNTAGVPPAKHRSGRALNTLAQRLKGKKGRFRYNLIGKRVNAGARTTISPSTEIKINEIGIPKEVADTLTVSEKVNAWNIKQAKKYILEDKVKHIITKTKKRKLITPENKKELTETLEEGSTIKRVIQDGDTIIFNRQPTLHRISIMGHKVKVLPGKTFRLNPISCEPYNADFDGDEMNVHAPQSDSAIAEVENLLMVENHILNIKDGEPIVVPDHDIYAGAYLLTKKDTEFSKKEAMELLYEVGITELPSADRGKNRYSGKLIVSQILPNDLNIEYPNKLYTIVKNIKGKVTKRDVEKYDCYFKVENGLITSGVLDEKMADSRNLIEMLVRHYDKQTLIDFYYQLSKMVFYTLNKKGLTVGLDEYKTPEDIKKQIEKEVKKLTVKANGIVKKFEDKSLPLISGKTLEETFELEMIGAAGESKDIISQEILKKKFEDIYNEDIIAHNNSTMIASVGGSRGKLNNVVNIMGLWGIVTVRTGRPKAGFYNRFLSSNKIGTKDLFDYGFVIHNFFDGMTPKEYFIHSIGGRQGEIDTGVSTKVSGYLYRRLSNALKDLTVDQDLSVKTADGKYIQYIYGDDGLSPEMAYLGKNINFFHE